MPPRADAYRPTEYGSIAHQPVQGPARPSDDHDDDGRRSLRLQDSDDVDDRRRFPVTSNGLNSVPVRRPSRLRRELLAASAVGAFLVLLAVGLGRFRRASPDADAAFFPDGRLPEPHSGDNREKYYNAQTVDHFAPRRKGRRTYSQRYYQSKRYFRGPGHPFLVVICGEDATDDGLLYPFVHERLASLFGGYVIQLEHRFYGQSNPVKHHSHHRDPDRNLPDPDQLKRLLTPYQAMADAAQIVRHKQRLYGCSLHKSSKRYCPVIAIGGSMPGFLAALMRIVHPDVVDIAYASSAPLRLYSQSTDKNAYYEKVTQVADSASPGCATAVRQALQTVTDRLLSARTNGTYHGTDGDGRVIRNAATDISVCVHSIPRYIETADVFQQELMMIIATGFADCNMAYYPPGPDTELGKACRIFQDPSYSPEQKIGRFLNDIVDDDSSPCFDMKTQLPPGAHATISAADWSGVGGGPAGYSWDFQTCDLLVCPIAFSEDSMFPARNWSYEWLTRHCESRFDVTPRPTYLVDDIGFDDLVGIGVTRMLFVNGINDGWSVASHLEPLSDTIRTVNIVNGAHHSDLSHAGPSDADTPEMKAAYVRIESHLRDFLNMVKEEKQ